MSNTPICPECMVKMKKAVGEYGEYYKCPNYAMCGYTSGGKRADGKQLSSPAKPYLRMWRSRAHRALQRYMEQNQVSRTRAYEWLSDKLGMPADDCHIGYFEVYQCQRTIRICNQYAPRR